MLSRKFGDIKKEHAKQAATALLRLAAARAGSIENVPNNEQNMAP